MFCLAHIMFKEIELIANIKKWEISHKNPDFRLLFEKWEDLVKRAQIPPWRQWLEPRLFPTSHQRAPSVCAALPTPQRSPAVAVFLLLVSLWRSVQGSMKYFLPLPLL